MPTVSHRMFNGVPGEMKISQEVKNILESAAEAFKPESYKKAAKYFKTALDLWGTMDNKPQDQVVILTKYMLYICWLESTEAADLMGSLRGLEELEGNYGYEYPMLYYAVGKAYIKLFRFSKADKVVKKGFSVLNSDINVVEYNIPGTNTLIPESSRERLVAALVSLNDQCSSWHCPNAVCCMQDCSSYSQNESADKNIFYESPTFSGRVVVNCNNTSESCEMTFHSSCWKVKKEQLRWLGKMSDKEVLNLKCFTPNCENQGVPCIIKKIVVYDERGHEKARIEARADDTAWHAKSTAAPKGAIRKQQQTPKVKVPPTEPRVPLSERSVRAQPTLSNVSTQRNTTHRNTTPYRAKVEEVEDEEEIDDEQALEAGIEKLVKLRAVNFGIKDDAIWRPDFPMYGNEYMIATTESMHDPDFSDEGSREAGTKNFFFSYFYEYISERGLVKIDALNEHWMEAKQLVDNSDCVLNHYLDISEFLLQSVNFAVVGDYICVAKNLPKAYELTKSDTCEVMQFFLANNIDQHSTCSSIDDEAVLNDIINQEKNNNSLPNPLISNDATMFTKKSCISNEFVADESNGNANGVCEIMDTPNAAPDSSENPKTPTIELSPAWENHVQQNGFTDDVPEPCQTPEETEAALPRETSPTKDTEDKTPAEKFTQESHYSVEYPEIYFTSGTAKFNGENENEKRPSSVDAINEVGETNEKGNFSFFPLRPNFGSVPLIKPKIKMNNCDPSYAAQLIEELHKSSMNVKKCKWEIHNLKSELELLKGANEAMRIEMLQKSLQEQYTHNCNTIAMKKSECLLKRDVCVCIRELLVNLTGQKWPDCETKFLKVKAELDEISRNTQLKYREYKELLTTTEPEKIEEFNLKPENMPDVPQIEPTIETAFGMYQRHMMEFHRHSMVSIQQQPTICPFQPPIQPQPQQMYVAPQQYFAGAPIVAGSAVFPHPPFQQNYNHPLTPNVCPTPPRNPPNSASPISSLYQTMPPPLNFMYPPPPVNIHTFNTSKSVQQPVSYSFANQTSSESTQHTAPTQRYTLPAQDSAPSATTNTPATTYSTSEQPKLTPPLQASSPLSISRSFTSFTQQNGQSSKESHKYPLQFSFLNESEIFKSSENSSAEAAQDAKSSVAHAPVASSPSHQYTKTPIKKNSISQVQAQSLHKSAASPAEASSSLAASKLATNSLPLETNAAPSKKISTSLVQETNFELSAVINCNRAQSVPEIPNIFKTQQRSATPVQNFSSAYEEEQSFESPTNSNALKSKGHLVASQNGTYSTILQAPLLFRDTPDPGPCEDIGVCLPENSPNYGVCAKPENTSEKPNNVNSLNAPPVKKEPRKNSEHSMDILMRKIRKQYKGVLELDLLKGVEKVREKHNNSLSRLPISRIIREAGEFIADRQEKQLCGYAKPLPRHHYAQSGASTSNVSEDKRYTFGSSFGTTNTNSLKKEPQHSLSWKKKWEPVIKPNDSWNRENAESDCVICLEPMINSIPYTLLCRHTFHKECLVFWYQRNQSCPTCRVHSTIDDEYPPLPSG